MTQPEIILAYLKDFDDWQYEYRIHGIQTDHGFIGARGDRDVRDLIRKGKVESGKRGKYRIVRYPQSQELKPIHLEEVVEPGTLFAKN